jgi:hypothetical protein
MVVVNVVEHLASSMWIGVRTSLLKMPTKNFFLWILINLLYDSLPKTKPKYFHKIMSIIDLVYKICIFLSRD